MSKANYEPDLRKRKNEIKNPGTLRVPGFLISFLLANVRHKSHEARALHCLCEDALLASGVLGALAAVHT